MLTHTHTQTPDSKKEEFRKYLEKNGVIDALTKGGCVCVCVGGCVCRYMWVGIASSGYVDVGVYVGL